MEKKIGLCAALASGIVLATGPLRADDGWHGGHDEWSQGQLAVTGGGCPIETPDGLSLMLASGRTGGAGDLDIWVVDRPAIGAPWSDPKNLPGPVNSDAADFCPSPFDRSLYFVSTRVLEGGESCGGGDIYLTRQSPAGDWAEPVHLPCAPDGPNTPGTERSPSLVRTWYGTFLFFSTNEGIADADDDIYVSILNKDGQFGAGHVVRALSTDDYQDQMPTVRARRSGEFEVVFNSDRPAWNAQGGQDAYYAEASFLPFWWSLPRNLGPNVNTPANETRASLSHDGKRLYVGRGDIYVSERVDEHHQH
jgi:WD40-like Beta Propeller Repeat